MSPIIAQTLAYGTVFVLAIIGFLLACWLIAVAFERFVEPLFMTPDQIAEREKRRLQERASRAYDRRPRQKAPTPMKSIKFFND